MITDSPLKLINIEENNREFEYLIECVSTGLGEFKEQGSGPYTAQTMPAMSMSALTRMWWMSSMFLIRDLDKANFLERSLRLDLYFSLHNFSLTICYSLKSIVLSWQFCIYFLYFKTTFKKKLQSLSRLYVSFSMVEIFLTYFKVLIGDLQGKSVNSTPAL